MDGMEEEVVGDVNELESEPIQIEDIPTDTEETPVDTITNLVREFDTSEELKQCKDRLLCIIPHSDLVKNLYHDWLGISSENKKAVKDHFLEEVSRNEQAAVSSTLAKASRLVYYLIKAFEWWTDIQDQKGACGVNEELARLNPMEETEVYRAILILQEGISRVQGLSVPIKPIPPRPTSLDFVRARLIFERERLTIKHRLKTQAYVDELIKMRQPDPVPEPVPSCSLSSTEGGSDFFDAITSTPLYDNPHIRALMEASNPATFFRDGNRKLKNKRSHSGTRSRCSSGSNSSSSTSEELVVSASGGDEPDCPNENDDEDGGRKTSSPTLPEDSLLD